MKRKMILVVTAITAIPIGGWALHKNGSKKPSPRGASSEQPSQAGVPPYYAILNGVTVPKTLPPQQFSNPLAREGYEIAAKIPKVLTQMPCYCHCDVMGHKSLLDCFTGKHAAYCNICLDSASFVYQRWKTGERIATIRQQLIEKNRQKN